MFFDSLHIKSLHKDSGKIFKRRKKCEILERILHYGHIFELSELDQAYQLTEEYELIVSY